MGKPFHIIFWLNVETGVAPYCYLLWACNLNGCKVWTTLRGNVNVFLSSIFGLAENVCVDLCFILHIQYYILDLVVIVCNQMLIQDTCTCN